MANPNLAWFLACIACFIVGVCAHRNRLSKYVYTEFLLMVIVSLVAGAILYGAISYVAPELSSHGH